MVKRWSRAWHKKPPVACKWCGDKFQQRRPWQEYCTDSHRVLASRRRREHRSA